MDIADLIAETRIINFEEECERECAKQLLQQGQEPGIEVEKHIPETLKQLIMPGKYAAVNSVQEKLKVINPEEVNSLFDDYLTFGDLKNQVSCLWIFPYELFKQAGE